jgi:hypothetical protein
MPHINCKNLNYFIVCTLFSSYREMHLTQQAEIFLFWDSFYCKNIMYQKLHKEIIRGLLEKYPTFGREKETGLLGALDT